MARIPIWDENDPATPADIRAALLEAGQVRGRVRNVYRAMGNKPETLRAFNNMVRVVYRADSSLEPKHAELAYLTATVTNNCFY